MEFKITPQPDSQIEAIIKVDQPTFDAWKKKAIDRLSQSVKLDGFRKGKVPPKMLEAKIGEHAIIAEILDMALPKWYQQLCSENNLQPISDVQPEILKLDPLELKITFAVWPEVKLGDPQKIKVKKPEVKVSEADIKKEIQTILDQNVEWVEVDRPSKTGDKIELDFAGFDETDKPIPNTESKNHPLILGSQTMIPGFEEELEKLKAGDEKSFKITFPKDYHADSMKDKKVTFKIKVHHVFEKNLPKFDDALAKKLTQGKITSSKELEADIKKFLTEQRTNLAQKQVEADTVAAFADLSSVKVPQILIDRVLEQMIQNFKQDITQKGLDPTQYFDHHKITEAELKKKWHDSAAKRAKEEIVLQKFADRADIQISDQDVKAEIDSMTKNLPEEQKQQVTEFYNSPDSQSQIKSSLRLRKTISELITLSSK